MRGMVSCGAVKGGGSWAEAGRAPEAAMADAHTNNAAAAHRGNLLPKPPYARAAVIAMVDLRCCGEHCLDGRNKRLAPKSEDFF